MREHLLWQTACVSALRSTYGLGCAENVLVHPRLVVCAGVLVAEIHGGVPAATACVWVSGVRKCTALSSGAAYAWVHV